MRTSPEIDKISEALAAAQGEFKSLVKNKQNPHFKNWYADLTAQIDATREALTKYGIFITQSSEILEGRINVITRLVHKTGQWLESYVSLKIGQDTPQGMGSHLTYARRYGRAMALDLSADDDDDGEIAQPRGKAQNISAPVKSPVKNTTTQVQKVEEAFKAHGISLAQLEEYFRKDHARWNMGDFDLLRKLLDDFKEGRKDKEIFEDYLNATKGR